MGMKLRVYRADGEVEVLLLPHKDGSGWSYINLTKGHICPCVFPSIESAINDLNCYPKVLRWEEIKENNYEK